jgi:O-antigen ligase/tetratricopeptide (TPR) repeat protein
MGKYSGKSTKYDSKNQKESPLNFVYSLILLAYGYVTVLTPNLMAFDSNGPKFLSIAILNLLVFGYLFTRKEIKLNPSIPLGFFKSAAGIFYTLLMVVSVLSFFKAINVLESILHFCKIFTVFSAAYLVSVVIASDRRYLKHLAVGMTFLLLFDGFSVFYNVSKYIKGELADIGLIKTVYSNKNILAASIFVKLPFALWLLTFERGWVRSLAFVSGVAGLLATLFMSSRAFYIGLFFLTLAFVAYLGLKYYRGKQSKYLRPILYYAGALVAVLLVFTLTQKFLYPKSEGIYNVGIAKRLSTISSTEESSSKRLAAWKRSFGVIKQEPLLGCGVGNWKVVTLKDENKTNPAYIYQYKAHNDFIETTTEVGIFGGLFFIAIFVFIILGFFKLAFTQEDNEHLRYLFLPAFGLMAYFFDAFFNFPQDRPEIQALFALFAGAGIALTQAQTKDSASQTDSAPVSSGNFMSRISGGYLRIVEQKDYLISKIWAVKLLVLLIFSAYVLILNFQSLKLQRAIKDEMNTGKLSLNSDKFVQGFPWVPDINVVGEPIAAQKARYLINEKKYDKAIKILKADKSSPYDTRPEYFIAMAYFNQGKYDSSLIYNQKVHEIKPYMFENLSLMSANLERMGKVKDAIPYLEAFLDKFKDNSKAWMLTTQFLNNTGELKKAYACIDSAYKYFPKDTTIVKRHEFQRSRALIAPYADLYNRALVSYQSQKYDEAVRLLTEFINKEPNLPEVYEYRAFSNYFTRQFQASITDIDKMFSFGIKRANLLNLRGVNLHGLGKLDEACEYFKAAMQAGNKDGTTNYKQFCGGGQQTQPAATTTFNPLLIKK